MIILDGGTGTLIQLLGAPMNDETWGADANLTHPEIVREAHRQYLAAGAEVLIANTYATSPLLFNHLGRRKVGPGRSLSSGRPQAGPVGRDDIFVWRQ